MKLKSTYLLVLIAFFVFKGPLMAQPTAAEEDDAKKHEKIEALRVAFITQKVSFTTQEAQAFWPLYNELNDKLDVARKTFRKQYNKNTNYNFATDKEAEAYITAGLTLKQKEYELARDYYAKFKKILPIKKVAALKRAEEEFKHELIKSIKGNQPAQPE